MSTIPDQSQAVYLWNPRGFDPLAILAPDLHPHADCARFFLHRIYVAGLFNPQLRGQFVPLPHDVMSRMFTHPRIYKRIRDRLIQNRAIVCDRKYEIGSKSYGYMLGKKYAFKPQEKVFISNPYLIRKMLKER